MNLTQRLNRIINMWNAGYHPAFQEEFINNTHKQINIIREEFYKLKNENIKLKQQLKDIDKPSKD